MQPLELNSPMSAGMDAELLAHIREIVGYPDVNISELARDLEVNRSKLSKVLRAKDGADYNTATLAHIARKLGREVRLVKPRKK